MKKCAKGGPVKPEVGKGKKAGLPAFMMKGKGKDKPSGKGKC